MSFSFEERPNSRETTMEPPSITFHYVAAGEGSQDVVRANAIALTPAMVNSSQGSLYRQDVRIAPEGFNLYDVAVPYGKKKQENGSFRLTFTTIGGTENRKVSHQTINRYPVAPFPDPAPDMKGAIGVNDQNVAEGAEVVAPVLKLSVHFKHPLGIITLPQIKQLARATGSVNSSTFLTFAAGEVLFLGASGSEGSDAETEVQYDLACSENASGLAVGDIVGIDKDGWDYLWIKFYDNVDGGNAVKVPRWAYVERVYQRKNLAALLGFGG